MVEYVEDFTFSYLFLWYIFKIFKRFKVFTNTIKMEVLSLNTNSKYNELVKYYEENKDKPIEEWLKFNTVLDKPGKQGVVGLFDTKENNNQYIFKISQYINYLVYHELIIMQGLKEINTYG